MSCKILSECQTYILHTHNIDPVPQLVLKRPPPDRHLICSADKSKVEFINACILKPSLFTIIPIKTESHLDEDENDDVMELFRVGHLSNSNGKILM